MSDWAFLRILWQRDGLTQRGLSEAQIATPRRSLLAMIENLGGDATTWAAAGRPGDLEECRWKARNRTGC
jgi:hypothetical protein